MIPTDATVPHVRTTSAGATPNHREQVILIGEYRFPTGDAAAVRTMSLARIFRDLGFRVTVIGKGRLDADDFQPELGGYFTEGIQYSTMNPEPVPALRKLLSPIGRMRLLVSTLESVDLTNCRAIVINASDGARHVPFVQAFCRRRGIPLIGDVCEWYDPRQMYGGWFNPFYLIFCVVFHWHVPRFKNLIVVSKLLQRRFQGPGRNVIRIAAPIDLGEIACVEPPSNERLVLLYAGMPGRKDLIKEILIAIDSLTADEKARLEFRLLGPSLDDLARILGSSSRLLMSLSRTVKPLGRVPREQVLSALGEAHFSVLLRPNRRYANAGFPSKVVESLAAGTPLILNFTSDLGDYLADETAVIAVRGSAPEDVALAIRRALRLAPGELQSMRMAARLKARQYFDYPLYREPVRRFLERLG